jgi:hypothetical protein
LITGNRGRLYEGVIEEIRAFNKHFHVARAMPEDGDPVMFYQAMINGPRGLPFNEGVAVKYKAAVDEWFRVKANDALDVKAVGCIAGWRGHLRIWCGCRSEEGWSRIFVGGRAIATFRPKWRQTLSTPVRGKRPKHGNRTPSPNALSAKTFCFIRRRTTTRAGPAPARSAL